MAESGSPPIHSTDSTGAAGTGNCTDTSTGIAYGRAAAGPPALTLAQTAALFASGTQVLFLSSNGNRVSTAVLTAAPTVVGAAVRFTFNATSASGGNTVANDPLLISTVALTNTVVNDVFDNTTAFVDRLSNQFCGPDWIIKLAPIVYQVDSSNSANPKLTRTQSGNTSVVMDQVIGFRIGASIWNDGTGGVDTTYTPYYYDPAGFPGQPNDFSLVRSLRVSVIARTTPNNSPNYHFRNDFDSGPYQIQGSSVIINPRNLSMND
jgi:hypothetical protein